jgi:hypothetical protein
MIKFLKIVWWRLSLAEDWYLTDIGILYWTGFWWSTRLRGFDPTLFPKQHTRLDIYV